VTRARTFLLSSGGFGPVVLAGLLAVPLQAQQAEPVRTVAAVDLDRYAGVWYEIARFPNWFQRRCASDIRATYARRPDGAIDVVNQCREESGRLVDAKGIARVVDTRTSAKLKVRFAPAALSFLPFVWGDYWILGLADDYSWAVVGSPDRKYLWVIARTPMPDVGAYASAIAAARANGFEVERLLKTPQPASPAGGDRSSRF
jgi:apolipoprotein D and lipocalin family protein